MDWLHQDKFRNWLILLLLVLNIVTVSIIWMQTARRPEAMPKEQGARGPESVNLMKRVLDLNETQTARVESTMVAARDQTKPANDRLSALKRQIAEEIFKESPDTVFVNSAAVEIGGLQAKIEMLRFQRFRDVVATCTPEQREKLKPIIFEAFGRKPPKDEIAGPKPPREDPGRSPEKRQPETVRPRGEAQPPREARPTPPSLDEKLRKYVERLNLSEEQSAQVREVLERSRKASEELRERVNPDREEVEGAKENIRKLEDESIMRILNPQQKQEFSRMIANRRK